MKDSVLRRFSVLTANVGNLSLKCRKKKYNLCEAKIERAIAKRIRHHKPAIVALQEINYNDTPQEKWADYQNTQARRLLGNDYTIITDSTYYHTCVAIHVDHGGFPGCSKGAYYPAAARTISFAPDPFDKFCVSSVPAYLGDFEFNIVFAHFSSRSVTWRVNAIRSIFKTGNGVRPLASGKYNLIVGDLNFDPFRTSDSSAREWNKYAGLPDASKPYRHHARQDKSQRPEATHQFLWRSFTLDHIVSNFAEGESVVLGLTDGTNRLDGGTGMDHYAVLGHLTIDPLKLEQQRKSGHSSLGYNIVQEDLPYI